MDIQIVRDFTKIYAFFTFGSVDKKKRLYQALFWIVFSIPFLAISVCIIVLDMIDIIFYAIYAICGGFILTFVLIPVAFVLQYVVSGYVIPLIQIPFYLISGFILFLRSLFDDNLVTPMESYYEDVTK